ncbi:MAG: nucleotide exchange factor GrpE [Clostridia bacterium]|nr:nucleotide exchange factor GrpE [Clostridia bacterium]
MSEKENETTEVCENETLESEAQATEQLDEWKDKYVRLYADFDNYKKRTQKEMLGSYNNGLSAALEQLLPVVDNFDRAMAAIDESDKSDFAQGVGMIYKQLTDMMKNFGVEPIVALGENFDPNFHDAVMHVDDDKFGENEIVEEFVKGYMIKDKVLRHSVVKVAN